MTILSDWYEDRVARLFENVEGADVAKNVTEIGTSGEERQIDVRIILPLRVTLERDFTIEVPLKIIADCKHYQRPLGAATLGAIHELKEDVQAQLALAVSPRGITKLAKKRAPSLGVYPITVPQDLLALADNVAKDAVCRMWNCYGNVFAGSGSCTYCTTYHVHCNDCFTVFAVPDPNGMPLACPAYPACGAVFVVESDREGDIHVQDYDTLETTFLTAAYKKSSKRLTEREVNRIIERTRWQYWDVDASPLIRLTEELLVEWGDKGLYLTDEGLRVVEDVLERAEPALWD